MKKVIFLFSIISLLMVALACNLPITTKTEVTALPPDKTVTDTPGSPEVPTDEPPAQEPTAEDPLTDEPFVCNEHMTLGSAFGVEFCTPTAIASGFTQAMIPEKLPDLNNAPWDFNPDTIEIVLTDYPIDNLYHDPMILIYPIDDFIALGENIEGIVTNLETLLADQPPNPDTIPFLPIYNAAQMMQGNVSYLDFRNGSGVRFITQYGQAAAPISNDCATYSFMGLTDNGQYFVSATFPINHELFYPDVLTEPAEGWEIFSENFMGYINNMESELAMQQPESFIPNLQLLDEMMSSFLIPVDTLP